MINKILKHFDEIGVDVIYNEDDNKHSFSFYASFDDFESEITLLLGKNYNISCECIIPGFPYADIELYEVINMLNKDSSYFKAIYSNVLEAVIISANLIYTNDTIIYLIDLLLESLISTDIEYIKNIYKYSHDRIPDDVKKIINEMMEE